MSNVRRTLSKRLSRTIIVLAIPIFVLSLSVFYRHANRLLHKEAVERSVTILNSTVQLVVNHLTTIETAARSNEWLMEGNFNPDSLKTISRRIVTLNRNVLSCSISAEPGAFPSYGEYFSVYTVNEGDTIITSEEAEFEYFEKNWYKKPMLTGHPCWINPFADFSEGTINHHDAVGSYCIPLRPTGGRIMGVVSADFSFQKLRESILATHHPYPSSYYMMLGPSGGYLIHPESSLLYKKTIFSANDSLQHPDIMELGHEMIAGHHGTMHVNIDGVKCHVCYAPVADTGYSLALVCHDDDVLADYDHLVIYLTIIVVIGLLIILLITRRVVKKTIGPLNELMEAANKIAEGDYSVLIPASTHKDAVGKLQNAFRKMQEAVLGHMTDIQLTDTEIQKESAKLEEAMPLAKEAYRRRQVFVHDVSDQMSAPLKVIEGLALVVQGRIASLNRTATSQKADLREEVHSIAQTMRRNALQLQRMTLMLFDSSDIGIANTKRYDRIDRVACNAVCRECIQATLNLNDVEVRFETTLPDSVTITTNRLFLTRTILELLHNAVKYSDNQHILLRLTETETTVRFIFEDTGPGLPKQAEDLVFQPFMKNSNLSEGLGLGLPLCYRHITSMGGTMTHDKDYTEGCRFILDLPKD